MDGLAGPETQAAEKRMASFLARKWKRPYSKMVGFVRARMALAVVRANSMLLRGSREKLPYRPHIQDGAAMDAWQFCRVM